jgi:hypothetical protein
MIIVISASRRRVFHLLGRKERRFLKNQDRILSFKLIFPLKMRRVAVP